MPSQAMGMDAPAALRLEVGADVERVVRLLARTVALLIVQRARLTAHCADALAFLLGRELLGVSAKRPVRPPIREVVGINLRASTRRSSMLTMRPTGRLISKTMVRNARCGRRRARSMGKCCYEPESLGAQPVLDYRLRDHTLSRFFDNHF